MVFGILKIKKYKDYEKVFVLGRPMLLIEEKDINKFKIAGNWYHKLPSFLKGGLLSKRRKFLCRVTSLFKRIYQKLMGRCRNPVPTFEIATNPTVKISDIKGRRFQIEK
jgi:hypothetical protein